MSSSILYEVLCSTETRKFGNKTYNLFEENLTEEQAKSWRRELNQSGYGVRIAKNKYGDYCVYIRQFDFGF